jgi:hypothetical protein
MLASLAEANLVVDFGLWSADGADGFLGLLFLVAAGTALSQILLMAVWFSCMNGSWLWRFGVPTVLTALIGYTAAIGVRAVSAEPSAMLVFPLVFQFPLFGLAALLWPICRIRGWRLAARASTVEIQRNQFCIGDVLAWMTIIGVLLTLVRFLFMSGGGVGSGIWLLLAIAVLPAPLLWAALITPLSDRPQKSWWLAIHILTLLLYVAVAFVICARLLYVALMEMPGPPGSVRLPQSLALTAMFFVGVPSLMSLNCFALRALGWRLVRQASARMPAVAT